MFKGAGVRAKHYTAAQDCRSFSHVLLEEGPRGEAKHRWSLAFCRFCWRTDIKPTCIGVTNLGLCEEKRISFGGSNASDAPGETMFLSHDVGTPQPGGAEVDTPSEDLAVINLKKKKKKTINLQSNKLVGVFHNLTCQLNRRASKYIN